MIDLGIEMRPRDDQESDWRRARARI